MLLNFALVGGPIDALCYPAGNSSTGRKSIFELHHYKEKQQAHEFFPSRFVKIDFRVLTPQELGLGATYDWVFRMFNIPVFHFQEQVVEWVEPRVVAYKSLTGWQMLFRSELTPTAKGTFLHTSIHYSLGFPLLDALFYPLVKLGLAKVYKRMKERLEKN